MKQEMFEARNVRGEKLMPSIRPSLLGGAGGGLALMKVFYFLRCQILSK